MQTMSSAVSGCVGEVPAAEAAGTSPATLSLTFGGVGTARRGVGYRATQVAYTQKYGHQAREGAYPGIRQRSRCGISMDPSIANQARTGSTGTAEAMPGGD